MPFPLVAAGLIAGSTALRAGANFYSQAKQRELYRYQRQGYARQEEDYYNFVTRKTGRTVRYPELSFPGKIRALDTGISQSYAGTIGTASNLTRSLSAGYGYTRSSGLFGSQPSRTSRWL